MRRLHQFPPAKRNSAGKASPESSERKGSTIVVVIALLLALTFLGIVAYTIGTQEHGNAEYFSDASKHVDFGSSRDVLFDWALRQIILGPRNPDANTGDPGEIQSALHGGHMSLMASMFGSDLTPYTGPGVNLHMTGTGDIYVDQNRDAMPDADQLLELKRAPYAYGAGAFSIDQSEPSGYIEPDADYNYWDINSPYLAYANVRREDATDPLLDEKPGHLLLADGTNRTVVLPSYHRPQYLRSLQRSDGVAPADWYRDPLTHRRVLRPHELDLAIAPNGNAMFPAGTVTSTPRFIRTAAEATALGVTSGPFPFVSDPNARANNVDMNPATDGLWDGIWSGVPGAEARGPDNLVEYDADPDGDGTREAIWLDLGFPMQVRENADGTSTRFVPMFGVTIYDADALLNLNAHGNRSGLDSRPNPTSGAPLGSIFTDASGTPFGEQVIGLGPNGVYDNGGDDVFDTRFISRSNQGARVSAVNPQWGLYAVAGSAAELTQHERFLARYGRDPVANPLSITEVSNLEWWWLMTGRPELDGTFAVQNLHAGRYGEVAQMDSAFASGDGPLGYPGPGSTFIGTPAPNSFTYPFLSEGTDDNGTAYRGFSVDTNGRFFEGSPNANYDTLYRVFPRWDGTTGLTFDHWRTPLDLRGRGRFTVNGTNAQQRLLRTAGLHRFPAYAFYSDSVQLGALSNDLAAGTNTELMPGFLTRLDIDEPEEMILVPSQARSDLDGPYGAGENAILHLTLNDQDQLGLSGRVRDLAPLNFNGVGAEDRLGAFTSTSFDLKSLSKPRYTQTETQFRNWEFSDVFDATTGMPGTDGIRETFPPQFGTTPLYNAQDPFRSAVRKLLTITAGNTGQFLQRKLSVNEICDFEPDSVDSDGDGNPRNDAADRFTERLRFRPLTPHPTGLPPERIDPLDTASVNYTTSPTRPEQIQNAVPEIQRANQEWLARRDRQLLCRDIYVLLYTFCGRDPVAGTDPGGTTPFPNVTNEAWSNVYSVASMPNDANGNPTPAELLEMAQFAVNLVDRLDPDDVVTKFEFDTNLSNGWNLNDNPYNTDDPMSTEGSGDRRVVYGVEQQQLTIHEAQVVFSPMIDPEADGTGEDHLGTHWNEEQHNDFTYIELENVTPNAVQFNANEAWQVVVRPIDAAGMTATNTSMQERRLTFRAGAPPVRAGANSRLLIATAGDQNFTKSTFNFPHVMADPAYDPMNPPDIDTATDFTRITPRKPIDTGADVFDLLNAPVTRYRVSQSNEDPDPMSTTVPPRRLPPPEIDYKADGTEIMPAAMVPPSSDLLVLRTPADADNGIGEPHDRDLRVRFYLRRRLNPHRLPPTSDQEARENPWIIVDELDAPVDVFTLNNVNATATDIEQQITGEDPMSPGTYAPSMRSTERLEPLAKSTVTEYPHFVANGAMPPNLDRRNSLGLPNPNSNGAAILEYNLYQTQTDRDFASIGELLNVPLYGPHQLVRNTADPQKRFAEFGTTNFNEQVLAATRFLNQPDPPNPPRLDLWHRLFEFLEVPDRSHRHYDTDAFDQANNTFRRPPFVEDVESRFFYRKPGRIQLNTLRHPQVLGGLLDDIEVMNPGYPNFPYLPGSGRNWFAEFIETRDGPDPDPNDTNNFFMPGLPVAKPYRSQSFSAEGINSRQHTVMRDRPVATTPPQQLFEVSGTNDPTLRYQLLDKVLNNSTNRSNVFLIFIQVDFFEAAEVQDQMTGLNVVRVGGKLDGSPAYRGFFVVDRSKILEILSQRDGAGQPIYNPSTDFLPTPFDDLDGTVDKFNFSFNQDFDYRQLILHRQTIN